MKSRQSGNLDQKALRVAHQIEALKPQHTPTPWRYQGELSNGKIMQHIYTAEGKYGHPASCEKEVDAAFIVRAVNAHAELLEALKTAYGFFKVEADRPDEEGRTVAPDSVVRMVLRKMNQAIAKAEGR